MVKISYENSLINLDTVKFVGLKNYWEILKKQKTKMTLDIITTMRLIIKTFLG